MKGRFLVGTTSYSQRAFTLIEIMVVVIIIGILAAMVAPKLFGRMGDAQTIKAKGDIATLESAIDLYGMDNFAFPNNEYGLDALVNKPNDPNVKNWKVGGYIKRLPKDPWGNQYRYRYPGLNGEVDIFTYGRDGNPGGEQLDADIGNWDLE